MVKQSNNALITSIIRKFLKKLYGMLHEKPVIKYNYTVHVYNHSSKRHQSYSVNDISEIYGLIPMKLFDRTYDVKIVNNVTNHFINFNL